MFPLLLSVALLSGCKDDEPNVPDETEGNGLVIVYPEDVSYEPYEVTNATAIFGTYDDGTQYITFGKEDYKTFPGGLGSGDEKGRTVILGHVPDEYKDFSGEVLVSGTMQFLYLELSENYEVSDWCCYYFKFDISHMELAPQSAKS